MEYSAHTNTTLVETSTRPVLVPEDRCTLIAVAEGPPKQTAPVGICSQLRGVHSSLKRCEVGSHLTTCACSDRSSTQRLNIWRLKSRMCSTAIRCTRKQVRNTDKNTSAESGRHRSETRAKLSKTRTPCGVWRKRRWTSKRKSRDIRTRVQDEEQAVQCRNSML